MLQVGDHVTKINNIRCRDHRTSMWLADASENRVRFSLADATSRYVIDRANWGDVGLTLVNNTTARLGVVVVHVIKGSAAEKAGLDVGHVIQSVDGELAWHHRDVISKIAFAPNGRDLVLLTISSKLKFYRLGQSARDEELLHVKDSYDITDMECVDFQITANNRFILCAGKEGVIKAYDYFMRGGPVASTQAFLGHFKHPTRLCVQRDLNPRRSCAPQTLPPQLDALS